MTARATRLDLETPFLNLSGAIHDLKALTSIGVTVVESIIKDLAPEHKAALRLPRDYKVMMLTEEQFRSVHFIGEHIRQIAEAASDSLDAVEALIVEQHR